MNTKPSEPSYFNNVFHELTLSATCRSSHPEVFLRKGVLEIWRKFTGEHPCRSVILKKLQSNFIEIAFRHECSFVNLLYIFRTPFLKNNSRWLFLLFVWWPVRNEQHHTKTYNWWNKESWNPSIYYYPRVLEHQT